MSSSFCGLVAHVWTPLSHDDPGGTRPAIVDRNNSCSPWLCWSCNFPAPPLSKPTLTLGPVDQLSSAVADLVDAVLCHDRFQVLYSGRPGRPLAKPQLATVVAVSDDPRDRTVTVKLSGSGKALTSVLRSTLQLVADAGQKVVDRARRAAKRHHRRVKLQQRATAQLTDATTAPPAPARPDATPSTVPARTARLPTPPSPGDDVAALAAAMSALSVAPPAAARTTTVQSPEDDAPPVPARSTRPPTPSPVDDVASAPGVEDATAADYTVGCEVGRALITLWLDCIMCVHVRTRHTRKKMIERMSMIGWADVF